MSTEIPESAWEVFTVSTDAGSYVRASIVTDKGYVVSAPIVYGEERERAIHAAKRACLVYMDERGVKWSGESAR